MENVKAAIIEQRLGQPLTVEHAANLLFFSFRFSQGDTDLQRLFFRYLHLINPDWRFQEGFEQNIFDILQERTKKFVLSNNETRDEKLKYHHPEDLTVQGVENILMLEIKEMGSIFGDREPNEEDSQAYKRGWIDGMQKRSKDEIVRLITQGVIERDYEFLVRKGKGRERRGVNRATLSGDPWSSHLIDYGLRENTTKVPEYDQMFRDVKDYIFSDHSRDIQWQRGLSQLKEVISVYYNFHPQSIAVDTSFLGTTDN